MYSSEIVDGTAEIYQFQGAYGPSFDLPFWAGRVIYADVQPQDMAPLRSEHPLFPEQQGCNLRRWDALRVLSLSRDSEVVEISDI